MANCWQNLLTALATNLPSATSKNKALTSTINVLKGIVARVAAKYPQAR